MTINSRMSLRLDRKVITELKQKALAEGKSINQFIVDLKDYYDFELVDGVSLRVDSSRPVAQGSPIYRVDIFFKETNSDRILRPLWYELWVEETVVEDTLHTTNGATKRHFAEYAFRHIARRFKENNSVLP